MITPRDRRLFHKSSLNVNFTYSCSAYEIPAIALFTLAHVLPLVELMSVADFLIIYLACGSPFGVYQITRNDFHRSGAIRLLTVTCSFLFWPIFGIGLLVGHFTGSKTRSARESARGVLEVRREMENVFYAGGLTSSLFAFREVFDRFTGLSQASGEIAGNSAIHEIFEITKHPNKVLASRCLSRRNRSKLIFHQARSWKDMSDLMSFETSPEMLSFAAKLNAELGSRHNLSNGFQLPASSIPDSEPSVEIIRT